MKRLQQARIIGSRTAACHARDHTSKAFAGRTIAACARSASGAEFAEPRSKMQGVIDC